MDDHCGTVTPVVSFPQESVIVLPSVGHGRLEGDDKHALGAHLFGQLIGGEGLAKAHLGVPQKAGNSVHILGPAREVVFVRQPHRLGLFAAHREGLVMRARKPLPGAQLGQNGAQIIKRAAHPFE